jgi:predicted nucleic acid binding AN1-type Zn finger protein
MNTEIFTDNIEMRYENSSSNTSHRRNSESSSKSDYYSDSKYFLICKSCVWCASCLIRNNMISKCPMCDNNGIGLLDLTPISDKEVYRIDCKRKRGITLEFASNDSKYYSRR